jgi:hypothetical protein
MKKRTNPREVAVLNRAAFQVERRDVGSVELLEELLSQVLGGVTDDVVPPCTEFTCNVYAPPPPPSTGG